MSLVDGAVAGEGAAAAVHRGTGAACPVRRKSRLDGNLWSRAERKARLVEDNMMRDDDASSREVKASVPFVGGRVTKEDASCGPWGKLVRCRGTKVWVA
jgi:hypothetical protein